MIERGVFQHGDEAENRDRSCNFPYALAYES
jgi:hypothetical protein